MKDYKYKISIIMPVYNVEKYLEESIQSVIEQSIGFKDNIQLILVNDGSKDSSGEICQRYSELYPNIIYINKENGGVSSARNRGFEVSVGKYIMFLDSDDILSKKSLFYLSRFLDKNDTVSFVISRVWLFEAYNCWHYMDYRFRCNKKIIDIKNDIDYCQYHSTGILFRREIINNIKFDSRIKYGEDMKYMAQVLLKNEKFGIEKKSVLYYRKREEENSAVQKQFTDKSYYLNTMEYSFKFIYDETIKKYGEFIKYFQYFLLNSLAERLSIIYEDILSKDELNKYIKIYKFLLSKMDDDIILMQKRLSINSKLYLLKFNHKKYDLKLNYDENYMYLNDYKFEYGNSIINIINIEKNKNNIKVFYSINDYYFKDNINVIYNKNSIIKVKKENNSEIKSYGIDFKAFYTNKVNSFVINLDKINNFKFISSKNIIMKYGVSNELWSKKSLPKKYLKISNVLVIFKTNKIVFSKYFNRTKQMFFLGYNIVYYICKHGIKTTIRKVLKWRR